MQHKLNSSDSARLWREQIFLLCQKSAAIVVLEFTLYILFYSQNKILKNPDFEWTGILQWLRVWKMKKNNSKTYSLREHAYGITDNCVFALFFHKLKWKHQIIQS